MKYIRISLVFIVCIASSASADTFNRFGKTKLSGSCLAQFKSGEISELPDKCSFSSIGRRARSFVLSKIDTDQSYDLVTGSGRVRKESAPYAIYSGQLKRSNRRAVALIGQHRIRIWFIERNRPGQVEAVPGSAETAAEHIMPSFIKLPCGETAAQVISEPGNGEPQSLPLFSPAVDLEMSLTADKEFGQKHGGNASSYLDAVVAAADNIYMLDIGLHIVRNNTTILSTTSGLTSNQANGNGELLDQFTLNYGPTDPTSRDVSHLVTGKNLNGDVIGLAWLGVVCNAPEFAYSLSEDLNSTLEPLIMAHELGHNLGADHDTKLMAPAVDPSNNRFSAFSIGQITQHINNFGTCLGVSGAKFLAVKGKFKKLSGNKQRLNLNVTPDENSSCDSGGGTILVYGAAKQSLLDPSTVQSSAIFLTSFTDLQSGVKQVKKVDLPRTKQQYTEFFSAILECDGALTNTTKSFSAKSKDGGKLSAKKLLKKAANKLATLG